MKRIIGKVGKMLLPYLAAGMMALGAGCAHVPKGKKETTLEQKLERIAQVMDEKKLNLLTMFSEQVGRQVVITLYDTNADGQRDYVMLIGQGTEHTEEFNPPRVQIVDDKSNRWGNVDYCRHSKFDRGQLYTFDLTPAEIENNETLYKIIEDGNKDGSAEKDLQFLRNRIDGNKQLLKNAQGLYENAIDDIYKNLDELQVVEQKVEE